MVKPSVYTYNIAKRYDRSIFSATVTKLVKVLPNTTLSEYLEDSLDGDQIRRIKSSLGEIKVINDYMVDAVWVESEINLDYIFKKERKTMRKNLGAKAILYPMPVLIIGTYDENGKPNAMNAAWGGISEETQISICVDDGHKTAKNVVKTGAFTVSVADVENIVACDYVGIVSGNKEPDKIEKTGWHVTKSELVDAPLFDELPLALECKLISYDEESCRLLGEIVNVCADERILGENGKIDLNKFSPITYDPVNHTYRKIGEVVGQAFSEGKTLE